MAGAARRAGFEPLLPRELGRPSAAQVSADRRVLSLCWSTGDGEVIRLDQFRATLSPLFWKSTTVPYKPVTVNGESGLWFAEPHRLELALVDEQGDEYARTVRTAGPTLLWNHDVAPWRVDMVHPDVTGSRSVWILTHLKLGPEASNPPKDLWHRAEKPDELRSLLTDLGVMSEHPEGTNPNSGPNDASDDISAATPPDAGETPATTATAATGADDGTDWWWAIPGLAAGAALALLLRPFAARLPGALPLGRGRERDVGPRQELRDV